MNDDILNYYERELTFIRQMGAEFAKKYPKIAGRLMLEPDKCEDPHTERLIEAFAFLSGRIHKKIDDDFPEITESLLSIIYPHYINPIPSMSVVKFETTRTIPPSGYEIEKGTPLYSKPVGGIPCQFATVYPITLWPVETAFAELKEPVRPVPCAQHAVHIGLKAGNGLSFSDLGWKRARFFLNGPGQHVFHLYELLLNNVIRIECEYDAGKGKRGRVELSPDAIQAVGFEKDEGMIPYPARSFPAYLLLFEYFCFPEKFLFIDLGGMDACKGKGYGDSLDIWIYLNKQAKTSLLVNGDTFCMNASPVVNLFPRLAEPVPVEERKTEYHVIPDVRRAEATEIFSVDRVTAFSATAHGKETEYQPFYSVKHHMLRDDDRAEQAFWHVKRRPSGRNGDEGTEIFLSFADWNFTPRNPDTDSFMVHVTCTNRDLPSRLPFGDPGGDFEMEIAAPVERIICLIKPTPTRRISYGGALQWRLISHLALNYMSLVEGGEEALKEILKLYDFDNSPATKQMIDGIASLKSEFATKRIGQTFCRGVAITIEFDEDKYVGTGLYLFASVLERFLGQYVSVNSFSQLTAKTLQQKEALKTWNPRSGNRVLL